MKTLMVAVISFSALSSGCAASGTNVWLEPDVSAAARQKAECEGQRGPGVWLASPGVCVRGGGAM